MSTNNEKTPVAANEQGVRELNQVQDNTDFECCQQPAAPLCGGTAV
jgi:hypothetical protein